jgi:hypothetical protein
MVIIKAAVPRSQTRSTAASDKAGRSVVNRSVWRCPVIVGAGVCSTLMGCPLVVRAVALADRVSGPSRVVRRARSSIGIDAKMISAEMTMIA